MVRDPKLHSKYSSLKVRERLRRLKERAVSYKGGQCLICGYSKSISALEFHHRDPQQKDFQVSGKSASWECLNVELDKCDLLCSNCHRELHGAERLMQLEELRKEVRGYIPEKVISKVTKVCPVCSTSFESFVSQRKVLCSRKCRDIHIRKVSWPSDEDLRILAQKKTPTEIAEAMGISPKTVRDRLRDKSIPWVKGKRRTGH